MSSKFYIGIITYNYRYSTEVQNFQTEGYTKSLQNLKECLYEALQICVKQECINYVLYADIHEIDLTDFSENDFIIKMKSELSEIQDESLVLNKFKNILEKYNDSYYNENWFFNLLECNLH